MRMAFDFHFKKQQIAEVEVIPCCIRFGGAADEVVNALAQLLVEHGVPQTAADERAKTIVEKIGRVPVAKACEAWKDIKALANGQSPKLQLVLPGEFADAIANRLQQPGKFGSKSLKMKRQEKPKNLPSHRFN